MRWVTKSRIRVGRAATAWLIRRFIDPKAELQFLADESAIERAIASGAIGFQVKGARYPHKDASGRTPFEALVAEYAPNDLALRRMGRIVREIGRAHV